MPIPDARFSGCCDWGTDLIGRTVPTRWYIGQRSGATDRLGAYSESDGTLLDTSAFSNADLVFKLGELSGVTYFYSLEYVNINSMHVRRHQYDGTLDWTYSPSGGSIVVELTYYQGNAIDVDLSGNVYLGFSDQSTDRKLRVDKIDSSGSQSWSTTITPSSGQDYKGRAVAVDSSGNVVAAGKLEPATGSVISYLNSSGTAQWTITPTPRTPQKVVFDASGNIYVAYLDGSVDLESYDSSGTLRYSKAQGYIRSSALIQQSDIVAYDGYLFTAVSDGSDVILTRRSGSSFSTTDWTATIAKTRNSVSISPRIAVDSDGNLFASWTEFTSPDFYGYFTKRNGSDGSEIFSGDSGTVLGLQSLVTPGNPPIFI